MFIKLTKCKIHYQNSFSGGEEVYINFDHVETFQAGTYDPYPNGGTPERDWLPCTDIFLSDGQGRYRINETPEYIIDVLNGGNP